MEKKSKKNAIIDAFAGVTQKRDNTYTSPMVMAPYGSTSYSSKNKKPVIVDGELVIPKQKLPESAGRSSSAIIRDSEKASPKDNAKIQVRDIVESVKTPESLVRKTIKDKIDREYRLKYPTAGDRVSDIGTRTVSAMKTLGGSVIGDVINDVSPRAANAVSKYTGGLITPTSQEDIEVGRLGTPLQKVGMVADGVSSVLEAQMFGKLMNVAGSRTAGKLAGEKIQSRATTAVFDTQKQYTKNAVRLSKELNEQAIPGKSNPQTAKIDRYSPRAESVVESSKLAESTDRPVSYNWDLISNDVSKMKDGTLTRIESMSRDTRRFLTSHGGMELLETRADGSFGSRSMSSVMEDIKSRGLYNVINSRPNSERLLNMADRNIESIINNQSSRFNLSRNNLPGPPPEIFNAASLESQVNYVNKMASIGNIDLKKYVTQTVKDKSIRQKLLEAIKTASTTVKMASKKVDKAAGKIVFPNKNNIDRDALVAKMNEELSKGVGIKKNDIPIKVSRASDNIHVQLDPNKSGEFMESGVITLRDVGTKQKTFTQGLADFANTPVSDILKGRGKGNLGLVKTMDFPTNNVSSSSRFEGVDATGVGGEVGEAIKRGLKAQNKKYNLYSSKNHTESGAIRYLTEYLNGRKTLVDKGFDGEWLKQANEIKKLYPNGIKKSEVMELVNKGKLKFSQSAQFRYILPAAISTGAATGFKLTGRPNKQSN